MIDRDIAVANSPGCVGECFRVCALSDLVSFTGASRKQSFTDVDELAYPLIDLPSQLSFSDPFGNIALRVERGVLAVARRVLPLQRAAQS